MSVKLRNFNLNWILNIDVQLLVWFGYGDYFLNFIFEVFVCWWFVSGFEMKNMVKMNMNMNMIEVEDDGAEQIRLGISID